MIELSCILYMFVCVYVHYVQSEYVKMKCSSEIFVRNTKPILEFFISHNGLSSILWNVIDFSCMYI